MPRHGVPVESQVARDAPDARLRDQAALNVQARVEGDVLQNRPGDDADRPLDRPAGRKHLREGFGAADYPAVGRRAGVYGALLLAAYDPDVDLFRTVCKCGTGFSDTDLAALPARLAPLERPAPPARVDARRGADVWVEPSLVLEVLGAELAPSPNHTAGLALRFPRFTGRYRQGARGSDHGARASRPVPQSPPTVLALAPHAVRPSLRAQPDVIVRKSRSPSRQQQINAAS
jgi:hypothetical protein